MPVALTGIRVFIATPGGLEDVRKRFFDRLIRFNHEDAHERGVTFIPVGWEFSLAGRGRPQGQINEQVRQCDYTVLVLHDRWGSRPAEEGPYSSGTEEEFGVARDCIEKPEAPMRDIAVMFRGVEPVRLADPGNELQKVLAFKERLEQERWLLFTTFDSAQEFEDELLSHLLRWTRDQESGKADKNFPPEAKEASSDSEEDVLLSAGNLLGEAKRLTKEGRLTRAESLYAQAVAGPPDTEALTQYTRFLRRSGRLDRALEISERLLAVGRDHNDREAQIEALSNKGIILRKRGDYAVSLEALAEAMKIAGGLAEPERSITRAFLLDNVALTRRKEGATEEALAALESALAIRREILDQKGLAHSLNNLGALQRQRGDLPAAENMHREAIDLFRELGEVRSEAHARANLGEVLHDRGDLEGAKTEYTESLEVNEVLKSREGTAMNYWQLGRVAKDEGDLVQARSYAMRCLNIDDSPTDRPESLAGAAHLFGQIEVEEGNFGEAITSLETALRVYRGTGQRLGAAWTAVDAVRAYCGQRDFETADARLAEAEALSGGLQHQRLNEELRNARKSLTAARDATQAATPALPAAAGGAEDRSASTAG